MLAARLRSLRKNKQKTQQEIADLLGITRSAYNTYEKGSRNPTHDKLNFLADYYETTVDYLLGRDEIVTPDTVLKIETLQQIINVPIPNSLLFSLMEECNTDGVSLEQYIFYKLAKS